MNSRLIILAIIFKLFIVSLAAAQEPTDVNLELQVYPTGIIPGIRLEQTFKGHHAASVRVGYQRIDHRDLGKQDDETGRGLGFTLGYKRYFSLDYQGWFTGIRNDLWWNNIDWRDEEFNQSGTSNITVIQPTIEAGHCWRKSNYQYSLFLAFGIEVNIQTEGRAVGEGTIFLVGGTLGI